MLLEKRHRPLLGSACSPCRTPRILSRKLTTLIAVLFSSPLLAHAESSLRFEDSVACAEGLSGSARTRILRAGFTDTSLAEAVLELVELDLESRRAIMEHVSRAVNIGSGVPIDDRFLSHGAVFPVKPIERLISARNRIIAALKERKIAVVVAGGGPAGLEIAANLRRLAADESGAAEITLLAGDRLLDGFDPAVQNRAKRTLVRLGIRMIEGQKAESADPHSVRTTAGDCHPCDFLFMAVGVQPSRLFTDSGLPVGADGGLLVNRYLQSVAHPEIFGGGDCISFALRPLAKVGVYAVRQNPVLLRNLRCVLDGGDPVPFNPQQSYLLTFNMGDGTAIVRWKFLVFDGRLGFALKDYLDRRFMKMCQA